MNFIHSYFIFIILGLFGGFVFATDHNSTSSRPEEEKNVTSNLKTPMRKDLSHWGRHLRDKIHHRCIRGRHHIPISSSTIPGLTTNLNLSVNQTKDFNTTLINQVPDLCTNESKIEEHKPSCENSSSISPRNSSSTLIPKDILNFWRPFSHFKTSENNTITSANSEIMEKSIESKSMDRELKDNKSTTQENIFILEGLGFFEDPLIELPKIENDSIRRQNWFNPFTYLLERDQDSIPAYENDVRKMNFWDFDLNKLFKFESIPSVKKSENFSDTMKLVESIPSLKTHEIILNSGSAMKTSVSNDSKLLLDKNINETRKIIL